MNLLLNGMVRSVAETFELPEPIVEVGSYQVEGQEEMINLRSIFKGREYLGVDMRKGPGVDMVADVEKLPMPDASVGTIIAISTFEHVPHFWKGFDEVRRVLRPDGALLISCPFFFYIHNYPGDYWRFTPQALELLLHDYPERIIGSHGPAKRPENVWALAYRNRAGRITDARFNQYRAKLDDYARQPIRGWRAARYNLARMLVGRGPFSPYLDQNRLETSYTIAEA
jgi:SAM-dependent methyltransferase